MSEKATLLTAIPPVKKPGSNSSGSGAAGAAGAGNTLEKDVATGNDGGRLSLLSLAGSEDSSTSSRTTAESSRKLSPAQSETSVSGESVGSSKPSASNNASSNSPSSNSIETVPEASVGVVDEPNSITAFQFVTYASFVLNFILAGAFAVILFKNAMKMTEERFAISAKALGGAFGFVMIYGFFATYLYNAHLNDSIREAPIFVTMAVWVVVGAAVGFVTRSLLARKEKPNRKAALIDAGFYSFVFLLAAVAVSSNIKTNAALLFAIVAGFLMIVPIARSLTAYKAAKARHKELNELSDKILIYGLLIIPATIPVLSFAYILGLSDSVTLFLINFITFDFVLVVALSMIASANELAPEESAESASVENDGDDSAEDEGSAAEPAAQPAAQPTAEPAAQPTAEKAAPQKIISGNPDDPIIQFLNSEDYEEEATQAEPSSTEAEKTAPRSPEHPAKAAKPAKPGKPGIVPPKKPGRPGSDSDQKKSASNAPSRLKAPAKPKKRF